jgi:hypothetical protein
MTAVRIETGAGKSRRLPEGIIRLGKPESVDREAGILYGAKILGLDSVNKRRYLPEAIQTAIAQRLYEGCAVNVNHPDKPDNPREAEDRFGWFENVRLAADGGLQADFHLLDPTEPLAVKLMNAAEKKPDLFGFSHNAEGDGYTDANGVFVVESITKVRSVDLVAEPATTGGIWEHRMKSTLRKFLEAVVAPKLKALKTPTHASKRVATFLEEMPGDEDMKLMDDVDMGSGDGYEDKDWKQCLNDAIGKLTASDDTAQHDMAKKLLAMLRPEEEEVPEEKVDGEELGADDKEEKPGTGKEKQESRKPRRRKHNDPAVAELLERVAVLEDENGKLKGQKARHELTEWVRAEANKRDLEPSAPLVEACMALAEKSKITAHLDWLKKQIPSKQKPLPRGQMPAAFSEGRVSPSLEGKSLIERLKLRSLS